MKRKTSKLLSILFGVVILSSFFMSWFVIFSPWDLTVDLFERIIESKFPDEVIYYLPLLIIVSLICSIFVIVQSFKSIENNTDDENPGKVISLVVTAVIIGAILDKGGPNIKDALEMLNTGFYIFLGGNIYFLIDLLCKKEDNESSKLNHTDEQLFCTNCGKPYNKEVTGNYCDECGSKL